VTFSPRTSTSLSSGSKAPGNRQRDHNLCPTCPTGVREGRPRKVLRQNVNLSDVYQTMQSFMGGYLVNYFNRLDDNAGLCWRRREYRTKPTDIGQFYVTNSNGEMVPLTAVRMSAARTRLHMRYNEYASAQIFASAAPGVSSGQAIKALEETFAQTMPSEMHLTHGMSIRSSWPPRAFHRRPSSDSPRCLYSSFLPLCTRAGRCHSACCLELRSRSSRLCDPRASAHENNVYAQIGLVMLIGLAAKERHPHRGICEARVRKKGKDLVDAALTAPGSAYDPS